MKKKFEVEFQRTSYLTITVEADDEEQAEEQAWLEIERGEYGRINDAQWNVESIEGVEDEHNG